MKMKPSAEHISAVRRAAAMKSWEKRRGQAKAAKSNLRLADVRPAILKAGYVVRHKPGGRLGIGVWVIYDKAGNEYRCPTLFDVAALLDSWGADVWADLGLLKPGASHPLAGLGL
jgi:hypothetical protein